MLNVYDYAASNQFFKKFAVDDLLFVEYKCMINESPIPYWTHKSYFVYILAGRKKWNSNNGSYMLHAGDAAFIRPGAYTAERFDDEEFCALLIFLTDDFIKSVLDKYPASRPAATEPEQFDFIMPLQVDDILSAYFHSLMSYFPQAASPSPELLKIKFEELILNVLSNDTNRSLANYLKTVHLTGKVSIRQVMESSFMFNMSLEEYARLCARSLSSFKADFYNTYKTTPGKWLLEARLRYAKSLVESSDEPINDVAFKSGFKNTTHFVRVFKDRYGVPPLQHRLKVARSESPEKVAMVA